MLFVYKPVISIRSGGLSHEQLGIEGCSLMLL
jgi:hypothetical protein